MNIFIRNVELNATANANQFVMAGAPSAGSLRPTLRSPPGVANWTLVLSRCRQFQPGRLERPRTPPGAKQGQSPGFCLAGRLRLLAVDGHSRYSQGSEATP